MTTNIDAPIPARRSWTGPRAMGLVLLAVGIVGLAACGAVIGRTQFTADLSAFLPRSPTPDQRALVEQLREGVVSRLVLIGIEGAATEPLAQASRRLAAALRKDGQFVSVANGEEAELSKDREFLWRHRYSLSPAVAPERFSARGLREELVGDGRAADVRRAERCGERDILQRLVDELRIVHFAVQDRRAVQSPHAITLRRARSVGARSDEHLRLQIVGAHRDLRLEVERQARGRVRTPRWPGPACRLTIDTRRTSDEHWGSSDSDRWLAGILVLPLPNPSRNTG